VHLALPRESYSNLIQIELSSSEINISQRHLQPSFCKLSRSFISVNIAWSSCQNKTRTCEVILSRCPAGDQRGPSSWKRRQAHSRGPWCRICSPTRSGASFGAAPRRSSPLHPSARCRALWVPSSASATFVGERGGRGCAGTPGRGQSCHWVPVSKPQC